MKGDKMYEYQQIMITDWIDLVDPHQQGASASIVDALVNDYGYEPIMIESAADCLIFEKKIDQYAANKIHLFATGTYSYDLIGDDVWEVRKLLAQWGDEC